MRLASLDIGRMIACLAVVLCHANMYIGDSSIRVFGVAGPLAVMFFMSLSGYVLAYPFVGALEGARRLSTGDFFRRRAIRIVPAYYVAILAVAFFKFLALAPNSSDAVRLILWNVVSHALFIHEGFRDTALGLSPAWHTMTLEAQYYLLFPVLFWLMRRLRSPMLFLLVSIGFSIGYNIVLGQLQLQGSPFWGELCLARLPEFTAGMALAASLGRQTFSWKHKTALGAGAIIAGVFCLAASAEWAELLGQQAFVFACLLLLRLFGPASAEAGLVRGLSYLGKVSYSTFLIHVSAGAALLKALGHFHATATTPLGTAMLFIGFVLAGHVAGILFHHLIEAPGSRLAERWLSPRRGFHQSSEPAKVVGT